MRKKLLHFKDNAQAANLLEPGKPLYEQVKGQWQAYLKSNNPLALELGCGRGTYTVALARRFPGCSFIGVDIKGARLWAGSQEALRDELGNAAFLRADIAHIERFFAHGEVSEIYIPFPDPRPREKESKKRLTSPRFLALYEKLLQPGGKVHLKTDNAELFAYTLEVVEESSFHIEEVIRDVHNDLPEGDLHRAIQTPYEKRFLAEGLTIQYVRFARR